MKYSTGDCGQKELFTRLAEMRALQTPNRSNWNTRVDLMEIMSRLGSIKLWIVWLVLIILQVSWDHENAMVGWRLKKKINCVLRCPAFLCALSQVKLWLRLWISLYIQGMDQFFPWSKELQEVSSPRFIGEGLGGVRWLRTPTFDLLMLSEWEKSGVMNGN